MGSIPGQTGGEQEVSFNPYPWSVSRDLTYPADFPRDPHHHPHNQLLSYQHHRHKRSRLTLCCVSDFSPDLKQHALSFTAMGSSSAEREREKAGKREGGLLPFHKGDESWNITPQDYYNHENTCFPRPIIAMQISKASE